jgi:hypothetical protein
MKTIAHYSRIALAVVLGYSLFACGGADENQDGVLPGETPLPTRDMSTPIAGLAMDGFIANGLVWIDIKDNDSVDGTEPTAYTDSQGYFSYNPNTGINYCEAEKPHLQQYCLKTGLSQGNVEVKVAKGVKVVSGVPFRNVLSTTVNLPSALNNFSTLVALGAKPASDSEQWQQQVDSALVALSPMGTVAHYLPENTDILTALSTLGIDFYINSSATELMQMNYVEGVLLETPQAYELLTANIMISTLVNSLSGTYDLAFEGVDLGYDGYPLSTADAVYQGLAESLSMTFDAQSNATSQAKQTHDVAPQNTLLINEQNAINEQFILAYRASVAAIIETNLRPLVGATSSQAELENIAQNSSLNEFITARINLINSLPRIRALRTPLSANANSLAITSLLDPVDMIDNMGSPSRQNMSRVTDKVKQTIEALINAVNSDAAIIEFDRIFNPSQIAGETAGIKPIDVDLQAIANAIQGNISNISELPSGSDFALANVENSNSIFSASHLSLSGVQDEGEQGQVVVFFDGNPQENSGSLIMCIAYRNTNDPSDNIIGQRFEGSWNTIGDNQNRVSLLAEGFSLQMNIAGETRGRDIPSEQQIASLTRNPNEIYGKFRFTLNEDSATWHSDDSSISQSYGLLSTNTPPANDADCANSLSFKVQ